MDALAALTFGTVIALNIREQGITEEKAVVKETISAGWIAGGCLILVYAMLNYVGMLAGGAFTGMENGTDVLLLTVHTLFGNAGTLVLALVFLIACFNTCVSHLKLLQENILMNCFHRSVFHTGSFYLLDYPC